MLISFTSLVKVQNLVSKTKRGEVKVMQTHFDWHDFTVSVLKCKEVRKIYRDHPYGLKFYRIILPLHFTLHNNNDRFATVGFYKNELQISVHQYEKSE